MKMLIVLIILLIIKIYCVDILEYHQATQPSIGKVWPKPKCGKISKIVHFIDPNNFTFLVVGKTCNILEKALNRYKKLIKLSTKSLIRNNFQQYNESTLIKEILVNLTVPCEQYPQFNMDEWYNLEGAGYILANSIWGILRGLETYSQLVTPTVNGMLQIPNIRINDSPRFPHRGLMLDTARRFINITTIFTILDGMAYNKLNVFHWHIVDDESFPYQSIKFPELSDKGAYARSMIYTQKDIFNVIQYARMRGIRVVAEFDIPGHSAVWGNSHPQLLTNCSDDFFVQLGPMYPLGKNTYNFLEKFFSEVVNVFPDKHLHLGGDEVDYECWRNNEQISAYVASKDISYEELNNFFMNRIARFLTSKSRSPIIWEQNMVEDFLMPKDTIVQMWLSNGDWINTSYYRVILSKCWYLEDSSNWRDFYNCNSIILNEMSDENKPVIGGEGCMWTDFYVDDNIIQRIFPLISAIAERLWSTRYTTNIISAAKRLVEHTCRMKLRGIDVESNSIICIN